MDDKFKLFYVRFGFFALLFTALGACTFLLNGCGVTRTKVVALDGTVCSSTTYTIGKDVTGASFTGCGALWSVNSSDPNTQILQALNLMLPYALKATMVP